MYDLLDFWMRERVMWQIRCNSSFELVSVLKVLPNVLAKKEVASFFTASSLSVFAAPCTCGMSFD